MISILIKKTPLFKDISGKLKYCTHTNIILTAVPLTNKSNANMHINKFNIDLGAYAAKLNKYGEGNVVWCDLNNKWGAREKTYIACSTIKEILVSKVTSTNKNLIFVATVENLNVKAAQKEALTFLDSPLPQKEIS